MTQPEDSESKSWGREKSVAIILAIFFGPFTLIYTYQKDKTKFAIFLLLITCISSCFNSGDFIPQGENAWGLLFVLFVIIVVNIVLWIWAILDIVIKQSDWYRKL
jgi:hypothetical protein